MILAAVMLVEFAAASGIAMGNTAYCNPPWIHHYQYHELAVALTEGHFIWTLSLPRSLRPWTILMTKARGMRINVDAQWDTAYYNGKYYCYFGILPVLVYYLPYYLLTGEAFPTFAGILINTACIIAGVIFLLDRLVKKYFQRVSLGPVSFAPDPYDPGLRNAFDRPSAYIL